MGLRYTTARAGAYGGEKRLAGHGVGLPLSRLYARYLGGALDLVSLPGYGTHAYVNLPRVESQQVEVVPETWRLAWGSWALRMRITTSIMPTS